SETLNNVDLCDFPDTGNFPSSEIYFSHGRPFVFSNNSSNVIVLNSPMTNFTRSATRSHKLQRGIAEIGASKTTFPLSTVGSYPKSRTSFATSDSKPIALVAINFTV